MKVGGVAVLFSAPLPGKEPKRSGSSSSSPALSPRANHGGRKRPPSLFSPSPAASQGQGQGQGQVGVGVGPGVDGFSTVTKVSHWRSSSCGGEPVEHAITRTQTVPAQESEKTDRGVYLRSKSASDANSDSTPPGTPPTPPSPPRPPTILEESRGGSFIVQHHDDANLRGAGDSGVDLLAERGDRVPLFYREEQQVIQKILGGEEQEEQGTIRNNNNNQGDQLFFEPFPATSANVMKTFTSHEFGILHYIGTGVETGGLLLETANGFEHKLPTKQFIDSTQNTHRAPFVFISTQGAPGGLEAANAFVDAGSPGVILLNSSDDTYGFIKSFYSNLASENANAIVKLAFEQAKLNFPDTNVEWIGPAENFEKKLGHGRQISTPPAFRNAKLKRNPAPDPPKHYYGRTYELRQLCQGFLNHDIRGIVICGREGSGKSALAQSAAMFALERNLIRQIYYVDCSEIERPTLPEAVNNKDVADVLWTTMVLDAALGSDHTFLIEIAKDLNIEIAVDDASSGSSGAAVGADGTQKQDQNQNQNQDQLLSEANDDEQIQGKGKTVIDQLQLLESLSSLFFEYSQRRELEGLKQRLLNVIRLKLGQMESKSLLLLDSCESITLCCHFFISMLELMVETLRLNVLCCSTHYAAFSQSKKFQCIRLEGLTAKDAIRIVCLEMGTHSFQSTWIPTKVMPTLERLQQLELCFPRCLVDLASFLGEHDKSIEEMVQMVRMEADRRVFQDLEFLLSLFMERDQVNQGVKLWKACYEISNRNPERVEWSTFKRKLQELFAQLSIPGTKERQLSDQSANSIRLLSKVSPMLRGSNTFVSLCGYACKFWPWWCGLVKILEGVSQSAVDTKNDRKMSLWAKRCGSWPVLFIENHEKARLRLEKQRAGVFSVRFSESRRGALVIEYVGLLKHRRLLVLVNRDGSVKTENKLYKSFQELVLSHPELTHVLGKVGHNKVQKFEKVKIFNKI